MGAQNAAIGMLRLNHHFPSLHRFYSIDILCDWSCDCWFQVWALGKEEVEGKGEWLVEGMEVEIG
jgi:hypothetical protein